MKNVALTVVCSLAFLFLVPICSATTTITIASEPTVDLAGLTTWTLTAQSDQGDILGFNFDPGGASGFGFIGSMNQVNPFGLSTIFNDVAAGAYLGDGAHISQDSHFGVAGSAGIAVNAFEDGNSLFGAWNISTGNLPILPLAQLTIPDGQSVSYLGEITVVTVGGNILESVSGSVGGGPDPNGPTNTPPVFVNDTGEAAYDQHTLATRTTAANYQMLGTDVEDDDASLLWTLNSFEGPFGINGINALPGSGNGAEMLSSSGLFTWDPGTFAQTSRGFYFAGITVMDSGGLTDTGILRVQVPEPSTFILAGLSLVGVFASRRRNS